MSLQWYWVWFHWYGRFNQIHRNFFFKNKLKQFLHYRKRPLEFLFTSMPVTSSPHTSVTIFIGRSLRPLLVLQNCKKGVSYSHKILNFIIHFFILLLYVNFNFLFNFVFFLIYFALTLFINNSSIFVYCISYETKLFNQYFSFSYLLSCKADFKRPRVFM